MKTMFSRHKKPSLLDRPDKATMIALSWLSSHDKSKDITNFTNHFVNIYYNVLNYKASMSVKAVNLRNNKALMSSISARDKSMASNEPDVPTWKRKNH